MALVDVKPDSGSGEALISSVFAGLTQSIKKTLCKLFVNVHRKLVLQLMSSGADTNSPQAVIVSVSLL